MLVLFFSQINAQEKIDGSFEFQGDPAKKYSIYIPSTYDENQASELMLGLHPLNTSRWDSESWRDTLIVFAETNNLLLVCPDGGADGKIDDPIDTAFTSLLLDSMEIWYNVDQQKMYAMGFSWGGLTTYTYGLNHSNRFAGFMPIGAAINGFSVVASVSANAEKKPYYIIHGSNDNPNTRFFPLRDGLLASGACVETNYMTGVGHTIDFPNRNEIMTAGLNWIRNNNCGISSDIDELGNLDFEVYPNPSSGRIQVELENPSDIKTIQIVDISGKLIRSVSPLTKVVFDGLQTGVYQVVVTNKSMESTSKRLIVN